MRTCSRSIRLDRRLGERRGRLRRRPSATATSAPMPLAQKPSIFPSARARAAVRPKFVPAPVAPGHRRDFDLFEIDAGIHDQLFEPEIDPRRGADSLAFENGGVVASCVEVGAHHEEPVHALALGGQQPDALPCRERGQRGVRRTRDHIDLTRCERAIRGVDREQKLDARGECPRPRGIRAPLPRSRGSRSSKSGPEPRSSPRHRSSPLCPLADTAAATKAVVDVPSNCQIEYADSVLNYCF